jgi:hypothetical protein
MAKLIAEILATNDRPAWDALWERENRPLVLGWDFLEAASLERGEAIRVAVRASANGSLVGGAAFVARPQRGELAWLNPAPAPWTGAMLAPADPGERAALLPDVLAAVAHLAARSVARAEWILSPAMLDVRSVLWSAPGWTAHPYYNYLSPVDTPDALAEAAEGSVRRQYRKALDSGMLFQTGQPLIDEVLELWESTRKRQSIPNWVSRNAYRQMATTLPEATVAAVRGQRGLEAGAIVALQPDGRAYYLLGCSRMEAGREGTGAPTLLQVGITNHLLAQFGKPIRWDWVGANTPSVAQYKKKFRPQLELCLRLQWKRGWRRFSPFG